MFYNRFNHVSMDFMMLWYLEMYSWAFFAWDAIDDLATGLVDQWRETDKATTFHQGCRVCTHSGYWSFNKATGEANLGQSCLESCVRCPLSIPSRTRLCQCGMERSWANYSSFLTWEHQSLLSVVVSSFQQVTNDNTCTMVLGIWYNFDLPAVTVNSNFDAACTSQ